MSILTVSVLGITAVLLAVQLKGKGSEYGTYIVMAAGLCLFFKSADKYTGLIPMQDSIVRSVFRITSSFPAA